MSREVEYVEVEDVKVIAETAAAILVDREGPKTWVPKSVLSEENEVFNVGDEGTLLVAEWFATKQEWT